MANPIKYTTATQSNSIKAGNFAIGVNKGGYGPTNITNFYNGKTPNVGGYTVYVSNGSGSPSIFVAGNDAALITLSNQLGASNLLYDNGVINWTIGALTINVSRTVVTDNLRYRIISTTFISPFTYGNFRMFIPLSKLVNAQTYTLSYKWKYIVGSSGFSVNDWCDNTLFNVVNTTYVDYNFTSVSGIRTVYDNVYRFMDFNIAQNTTIEIWDVQLEQKDFSTPFISNSSISTVTDALNWFNSSTKILCTNMDYPNIVTSGLVLNLDAAFTPSYPKNGTTWKDLSGNGNNGTLVNDPGFSGGSISFDGSNDYVIFSAITLSGNFTISQMVNLSSTANGPMPIGGGLYSNGSTYTGYVWFRNSVNEVRLAVNSEQIVIFSINSSLWVNKTILYTVKRQGTIATFYIDGVEITSGTISTNNFDIRTIGYSYVFSYASLGTISNTMIYNRALSAAEVLQNYYAGLQRFIPTSGLVLWLDAQNPNRRISNPTIAYDVSGNVNNGNLANAISLSTNGGTSFSFDGIDDYISIPYNTAMDPTTGITLEFWINPSDISTTDYMEIFRKNISPGLQLFSFQLNGTILSFGNDTAINGYSELDIPINSTDYVNQWVHVVASYSSGLKSVYRNGILIGSTTWVTGNLLQGATDYFIGSLQGYSEFFKGLMASIKVYNRKLTSTEILSSYNSTKTRYFLPAEGLSLFLDSNNTTILNGAYQNVSNDASGNNYNGDMTNDVGISNDAETSFSFDGIDDYITIPTLPSSTFSGDFTIDFWIKDGRSSATGWNWYMKSGAPGDLYSGIFIASLGSILRMSIGTWFTDVIDYWNIQVGVWTKITITRNSNYVYSYCNGVQSGGSIYNDVAVGVGGFVLGQGPDTAATFIGKISQFSLYKRSLTPTEILQTYELQKARYINYFTNGDFSLGNTNFTGYGATMNSTVTLSGMSYSLQMPQVQYGTFTSDDLVQIDISKSYQYTVYTRTLTKGGPGNDILSGGHMGFSCYDSSQRFIDLRNCGGKANTTLTRALNAGDTYAYVSNVNSTQWYPVNDLYYFRHFMVYPPTHPEFGKKWEYTRIGFGDFNIYYSEITDIGGGELRIKFCDADNVPITFPNIGYPTPIGTGIMNGQAGSTYNYAFYPTTGDYGSWTKYISTIKGTARDAFPATTFRYATKYIKFLHLINYAIPSGTTPLPIMLIGGVKLKQIS